MPYLVCMKCGGYYQLQEGESPDDFSDKCQCGGDLRYIESLEELNLENFDSEDLEDNTENSDFESYEYPDEGSEYPDEGSGYSDEENPEDHELYEEDDTYGLTNDDNAPEMVGKTNKISLSGNLFRISALMVVIAIIVISACFITYRNSSYAVFGFNEYEKYSDEEINCFLESAFNLGDYGNNYNNVGKWNINVVRIKVIGSPTDEDMNTLNQAIDDINNNVKNIHLEIDDRNQMEADMEVYFISHSEFSQYSVDPLEADGFTMWRVSTSDIYGGNSAGEIFKARVFIGTDQKSQERRSHVIVHELAHALGLHHNQNQNSVLCKYGPDLTEYTDLDKTMMRMLYREDILPYMSRNEVETIINNSGENFF